MMNHMRLVCPLLYLLGSTAWGQGRARTLQVAQEASGPGAAPDKRANGRTRLANADLSQFTTEKNRGK